MPKKIKIEKTKKTKKEERFQIVYKDPKTLIPYGNNTKIHTPDQIAKLKDSIQRFDFDQPIVVDEHNIIIKGHGRLMAAQASNLQEVPVIVRTDLTPEQVRQARIADNKVIGQIFDNDMMMLEIGELKEFDDFDPLAVGFDEIELQAFEDEFNAQKAVELSDSKSSDEKNDFNDEAEPKYEVHTGDIAICGNHKVICGSSTEAHTIQNLFGDETVDMLLTDPPYGVNYSEKQKMLNDLYGTKRNTDAISNDAISDYKQFFTEFLSLAPMAEKNTAYITLSGNYFVELILALREAGFTFSQELVWYKNQMTLTRKDYHTRHELIAYGWKGSHEFNGPKSRKTVLEYDRPRKATLHPTMKPVELFEQLIQDGSKAGDIVYDAFGGSGTTMIAAELTGRKARVVELSPKYVSTMVDRWEQLAGKKAVWIKN